MKFAFSNTFGGATIAAALAAALTGCSSFDFDAPGSSPAIAPTAPPAMSFKIVPPDPVVGKWGFASYHDEKDRARNEKLARVQCKNPYIIAKGPTDGVMTRVADDPNEHELALKKSADGKTYLGFNAPPGDPADRESDTDAAKRSDAPGEWRLS